MPFVGKRDWVSKAIVHLDGSGAAAEALAAVGVAPVGEPVGGARSSSSFDEQPGQPLAAQIDGEEFPATACVRIDVAARALRLIVPAEAVG